MWSIPRCPEEGPEDEQVDGPGELGPEDFAPDREPWTWSERREKINEPNRTTAEIVTVVPPGGVVGNPPGIDDFPRSSMRLQVFATGEGCVENRIKVGDMHVYWQPDPREPTGVASVFDQNCRLLNRNGTSPQELAQEYRDRQLTCARSNAFAPEPKHGEIWWVHTGPDHPVAFRQAQERFFACAATACQELNQFDAEDADGDGLNDTCDCDYLDLVPERPVDRTCKVPGATIPRWMECQPGEEEPSCTRQFNSYEQWVSATLYGGAPDLSGVNGGAGVNEDHESSFLEYDFEDGIEPNCPEGAHCESASSRKRGALYDEYLCKRLLREHSVNRQAVECKNHPNPDAAWPSYRTTAWHAEINPQAGVIPPPFREQVPSRQFHQNAGSIRYPDYMLQYPRVTILGEAKCYRFMEWNRNSLWMWFRAVSFTAQFAAYMSKVIQNSRNAEMPHWAVHYHFCGAIPGWLRNVLPAGYSLDGGAGNFHIDVNDSGGRNFIKDPIWLLERRPVGMAINLFKCFVPGGVAGDGVNPADSCLGSWYDTISGSE